jgi:arsenical pump membrane protein
LLPWLRIFLLPAGAAILATYLTMRLLFRRTLQGEVPHVLEDLRLSTAGKLTVLGVIATAGVLLFCSATGKSLGLPNVHHGGSHYSVYHAMGSSGATRRGARRVLERVTACSGSIRDRRSAGFSRRPSTRPKPLPEADRMATACRKLHNGFWFCRCLESCQQPSRRTYWGQRLHAPAASGHLANAMLMGIDLGPNLSVTGSLATILWLIALRRENLEVSAWSFLKVGVIVMPAALLLAGLFLWFTSPQKKHYPGEPKRSANFTQPVPINLA